MEITHDQLGLWEHLDGRGRQWHYQVRTVLRVAQGAPDEVKRHSVGGRGVQCGNQRPVRRSHAVACQCARAVHRREAGKRGRSNREVGNDLRAILTGDLQVHAHVLERAGDIVVDFERRFESVTGQDAFLIQAQLHLGASGIAVRLFPRGAILPGQC